MSELSEKLTSANKFQIEREKLYDYLLKFTWRKCRKIFLEACTKFSSSFYVVSLA